MVGQTEGMDGLNCRVGEDQLIASPLGLLFGVFVLLYNSRSQLLVLSDKSKIGETSKQIVCVISLKLCTNPFSSKPYKDSYQSLFATLGQMGQ